MRLTVMLVALTFLAGCTVHRPATPVPPEVPHTFQQAEFRANGADKTERWWTVFGDPQLNRLIERAFDKNLDLEQLVARLDEAEALVAIAGAGRQPQLTASGSAGRESSPAVGGTVEATNYRLSLAASYEIDIWRRLKNSQRAAELNAAATREQVEALYLRLTARIADLYYLAIEQREQLALNERTVAAFEESLALVEYRYREGLVPSLDVYQARQSLAAARALRPQYEAAHVRTEHALSVLLGSYPGTLLEGEVIALPETPDMFEAGLPSTLITRRPDVRGALLKVRAGDAEVAAALADRFPRFNLLADYGSLRRLMETGDVTGTFWSFAASLTQPLWDGGRRAQEVARRRAGLRAEVAAWKASILTAFREVEDALAANRSGEEQVALNEARTEAAAATLRAARDRYRQGLSDYLPVLTAQNAYFSAESRLLASRRELISERISLGRALGGHWMNDELQRRYAADGEEDE